MEDDRKPVSALRNLGPGSAMMLAAAGVRTIGELRELGAAKAYLRVREMSPKRASLNLLWAIAAGLEDRDWRTLSRQEKDSLLLTVRRLRR